MIGLTHELDAFSMMEKKMMFRKASSGKMLCNDSDKTKAKEYRNREAANTAQTTSIMRLARLFASSDFLFAARDVLFSTLCVISEKTVISVVGIM